MSRLRRIASYICKRRVCDAMPQALFMCVGRPASRRNRPFSCVTRPVSTPRHVSASSPAISSMLRPVESFSVLTFPSEAGILFAEAFPRRAPEFPEEPSIWGMLLLSYARRSKDPPPSSPRCSGRRKAARS